MPDVWFGRKDEAPTHFENSDEFVALRTLSPHLKAQPEASSFSAVVSGAPVLTFPEANVSVYRVDNPGEPGVAAAKEYLQSLSDVRADGFYTAKFGGTSSACPGAAGVAALILSVRPKLTRDQVKDIIAATCEKIDAAGGTYNAQGWSPLYGYGRIDAEAAVKRALTL